MNTPNTPKPEVGFKPIDIVRAISDYYIHDEIKDHNKLTFFKGDIIYIVTKLDSGWWDGVLVEDNLVYTSRGSKTGSVVRGWLPSSYVRSLILTTDTANKPGSIYSGTEVVPEIITPDISVLNNTEKLRNSITSMINEAPKAAKLKPDPECYDDATSYYIPADRNLFYLNDSDIVTWNQLFVVLNHYLDKTKECFTKSYDEVSHISEKRKSYRPEFRYNYTLLGAYVTYLIQACEILKESTPPETIDPVKKHKVIKLLSEDLIHCLGVISESAHVWYNHSYYTSYSRSSHQQGNNSTNDTDIDKTLIISRCYDVALESFDKIHDQFNILFDMLNEFSVRHKSFIIPQLFPRFMRLSFNGGSWSNPFLLPPNKLASQNPISSYYPPVIENVLERTSGYHRNKRRNSVLSSPFSGTNSLGSSRKSSSGNLSAAGQQRSSAGSFSTTSKHTDKPSRKSTGLFAQYLHANKNYPVVNPSNINACKDKFKNYDNKIGKFPLSRDTLELLEKRKGQIHVSFSEFNELDKNEEEDIPVKPSSIETMTSTAPSRSKVIQSLEANFRTYKEINTTVLIINILENLDLTMFTKMRHIVVNGGIYGWEFEKYQDLMRHTLVSVAYSVEEFYKIKQTFHDIAMRLIMCSQHTTLEDPYVFSTMKSNYPVGALDPISIDTLTICSKADISAYGSYLLKKEDIIRKSLYERLLREDAEFNYDTYYSVCADFRDARQKYVEMADAACAVVSKLVEERDKILNYAARTMQSELVAKLLEDEEINEYIEEEDSYYKNESNVVVCPDDKIEFVPWYLQPNYTAEVIFDSKGRMKGANKRDLFEYLFQSSSLDMPFAITLLITFRTIFTSTEFIVNIIERFEEAPPENLSYEEYNDWIEKKYLPNKERVIYLLWKLFKFFWNERYMDFPVALLENCIKTAQRENIAYANELYTSLNEIKANNQTSEYSYWSLLEPSNEILEYNNDLKRTGFSNLVHDAKFTANVYESILDIPAENVAQQLALIEENLYEKITIFDCLDRVWGCKQCDFGGSKNISDFISFANSITKYVSYKILQYDTAAKRGQAIGYFIKVARISYEINNFSSMTAIISGIYASPVNRLHESWKLVSRELQNTLRELDDLMISTKNFLKYRLTLKNVGNRPCIPFFGVYLSDLLFTHNGNPDYVDKSRGAVNFTKRFRIFDIIQEIFHYKKVKYEYKADLDIIHHIMNVAENVPDVENQYHLSLQLEPRSKSTSTSSSGDTATIVDIKKEEESQQTPKKGIRKHFHMKSKNPENKVLVNKGKEKSRKKSSGFRFFGSRKSRSISTDAS